MLSDIRSNEKGIFFISFGLLFSLLSIFIVNVAFPSNAVANVASQSIRIQGITSDSKMSFRPNENFIPVELTYTQDIQPGQEIYLFDISSNTYFPVTSTNNRTASANIYFVRGSSANFVAYIADSSSSHSYNDLNNITAQSEPFIITREQWQMWLSGHYTAGSFLQMNFHQNQYQNYTYGTYAIYMFQGDTLMAYREPNATSGDLTIVTPFPVPGDSTSGLPILYNGYVAKWTGGNNLPDSPSELIDIQVESNYLTVTRKQWQSSFGVYDGAVQFNINRNIDTVTDSGAPFSMYIVDSHSNRILKTCSPQSPPRNSFTTCTYQPNTNDSGFYRGFVASSFVDGSTTVQPKNTAKIVGIQLDTGQIWRPELNDLRYNDAPTVLYSSTERIGGRNYSETCNQKCVIDPVNTATGEFWESYDDVKFKEEKIISPIFTRSYSATKIDSNTSNLGYGWTHNYSMNITSKTSGPLDLAEKPDVLITQENGSTVEFLRATDGTYAAESKVFATLEYNEISENFIFSRDDKVTYLFDKNGKLSSIKDKNNNSLVLSYNENSGLLESVASNTGQSITVVYGQNNLISNIVDSSGRIVEYTYDSNANLISVDQYGAVTSYTYNNEHLILTKTNPLGGIVVNTYDSDNRVIAQENELGNITNLKYSQLNPDTVTTTISYPNGKQEVYTYDAISLRLANEEIRGENGQNNYTYYKYNLAGNVTETGNRERVTSTSSYNTRGDIMVTTDSGGRTTSYTYDNMRNVTTITNALGKVATLEYDSSGNMISTTNFDGGKTTNIFDSNGNIISNTTPLGNVSGAQASSYTTNYSYDNSGYLQKITNALGGETSFAKDLNGNTISTEDALDQESLNSYDNFGNILSTTNAIGNTTTNAYDLAGNIVSSTDTKGNITLYTYDVMNNLLTKKDAKGNITSYTYDDMNNVISIKDAEQNISFIKYDVLGRIIEEKDAKGNIKTQEWDNENHLIAQVDARGNRVEYKFNLAGEVSEIKNQLGGITLNTYDALGRKISTQDPLGGITNYTYDDLDNIIKTVHSDGSELVATYDLNNNLISQSDTVGMMAAYTYDALGNKLSYTNADGEATNYSYNANSLIVNLTNPDSTTISYSYDSLNNQIFIDYSDSGTQDTAITYDERNLIISKQQGGSNTNYIYDQVGNLTYKGQGIASNGLSYTYDNNSNVVGIAYPSGAVVNYERDENQNIEKVFRNSVELYEITYDPTNNIKQTHSKSGNDVRGLYSYNSANQLSKVVYGKTLNNPQYFDYTIFSGKQLTYSNSGSVTNDNTLYAGNFSYRSADETYLPFQSKKVQTDEFDRVTKEGEPQQGYNPTVEYDFDSRSNLTQMKDAYNTTSLSHNNLGQITQRQDILNSHAKEIFSYDDRGNRTKKEIEYDFGNGQKAIFNSAIFQWNQNNELTSAAAQNNNASYSYDVDGLLATRNATLRKYPPYDPNTYDPNNPPQPTIENMVDSYTWDINKEIPTMVEDGKYEYLYANSYVPFAQVNKVTGVLTYLYTDQVGSVIFTTSNENNNFTAHSTSYGPYGTYSSTTVLSTNNNGGPPQQVERKTKFGYAGQYQDDATSMYYMRARWYDPATMSFISQDPLVQSTQEPYSYASGNPITKTDPLGLDTLGICINGTAAFGGMLGIEGCVAGDGKGSIGFTGTAGGGNGIPGVSGLAGIKYTSADTLEELSGKGTGGGLSAGEVTMVGAEYGNARVTQVDSCGNTKEKRVHSIFVGAGLGLSISPIGGDVTISSKTGVISTNAKNGIKNYRPILL